MTETVLFPGAPQTESTPHINVTDPHVMQGIKEQFEAMSEQTPIEWIGKLTDLIPAEQFHGSVSVANRLEAGELTQADIDRAKEYVPSCFVPTTKGAGIRCVEDRNEVGYDDANPASYQLGPEIQGGIIDIAVAKRLARGIDGATTVIDDIQTAIEEDSGEFTVSTHTDTAHQGEGEMGCGAQKGQEAKLGYYQDAAHMQSVASVSQTIFEKAARRASEQALATLPRHAANLAAVPGYFTDLAQAGEYVSARTDGNAESHKVVEGVHNAALVILNFDGVSKDTFNPGKLNTYTDDKVKSFGLDVWYILEAYPEDEATILIADAVATLMNLTDGTLEVGLRLPQAEPQQK